MLKCIDRCKFVSCGHEQQGFKVETDVGVFRSTCDTLPFPGAFVCFGSVTYSLLLVGNFGLQV